MEVNIHEAKTNFSRLLARVAAGEEVIISRAGTPIAKLSAYHAPDSERVLGRGAGQMRVPEDFDDPLPESVLKEFFK